MMSPIGGGVVDPSPMTVTYPGLKGVESMGNYPNTCSLFLEHDVRGK